MTVYGYRCGRECLAYQGYGHHVTCERIEMVPKSELDELKRLLVAHHAVVPGIFEACCTATDAREWFAYLWPHRHEAGDLHRPFLRWLIARARS